MTDRFQRGAFLVSRDLFDSSLWQLPPDHFRVAVYLLGKARHKTKKHNLPDGTSIGRGELVTSMLLISQNCSYYENRMVREMSRKKSLKILENLENIGFLKRNSHSKGTHISICNYDSYQQLENYKSHEGETVREQWGNSEGTPRDTNKKGKKEKKAKNENNEYSERFNRVWFRFGSKGNKKSAERYWIKLSKQDQEAIEAAIPAYVASTPEFQYRKDFSGWINPDKRKWEDKIVEKLDSPKQPEPDLKGYGL